MEIYVKITNRFFALKKLENWVAQLFSQFLILTHESEIFLHNVHLFVEISFEKHLVFCGQFTDVKIDKKMHGQN